MLAWPRRKRILEFLADAPEVEVAVLAARLGCSVNTIRRDLAALHHMGHIRRVHGGAVAAGTTTTEPPPLGHRADRNRRAKEAIADAAIDLLPTGGLVFLGGGSTVLALAARLAASDIRVSFVTQVLDLAIMLATYGRHEVYVPGGLLHAGARTVGGPDALGYLADRIYDVAVFGAAGIDPEHGVMGPTPSHHAVAAVIRRQARRRILVADHSKFGRDGGPYRLYGFECLDTIVTDRAPPPGFAARLTQAGVRLVHG